MTELETEKPKIRRLRRKKKRVCNIFMPRLILCVRVAKDLNKTLGLRPPIDLDERRPARFKRRIKDVFPLIKKTDKLKKGTLGFLRKCSFNFPDLSVEEVVADIMLTGGGNIDAIIAKVRDLFPDSADEAERKTRDYIDMLIRLDLADHIENSDKVFLCAGRVI